MDYKRVDRKKMMRRRWHILHLSKKTEARNGKKTKRTKHRIWVDPKDLDE